MLFLRYLLNFTTSSFFPSNSFSFKGYLSAKIGHVHWIVHHSHSFLIPYLEQMKGPAIDALLTTPILREHRYKKMGEFEVTYANKRTAYLVKIYHYPRISQKIKQLFKHTRGFHEFAMNYLTAMKGVPAEVPVGCGERRGVFTKESYIIIKKIEHCHSMREYLRIDTSRKERRDVLKKFGKLSRTIYDSGVRQDAFSLDNFLVYHDETGNRKVILIDFEMVSIKTKGLRERLRIWYLAKLNREKRYFTNTDRMRFLMSYAGGDFAYSKKLAREIEALTVRILKKDAQKYRRLCTYKNKKFNIFRNTEFYGYYRKDCLPESLIKLLPVIGETSRNTLSPDRFWISRFAKDTLAMAHYRTMMRAWKNANALFALTIDVPTPLGIFSRNLSGQKEGFLVSHLPDNSIPLHQYPDIYSDQNLLFALLRFGEHISFFGVLSNDLSTQDILVQRSDTCHPRCYLGNYSSFRINRLSTQKNRLLNTYIIKHLYDNLLTQYDKKMSDI